MKILYFSATGNSLYVAKSLGGELLSIPQMIKEERYEFADEKIGIVFPLHAWMVNSYVEGFLKKVKFNCKYLFAIITYRVYTGGVATHLLDIGSKSGLNFSYVNKIKMVDNYLPGFNMKNQIKNEHKKHIEQQILSVKADIDCLKKYIMKESIMDKFATNFMVKRASKKNDSTSNNKKGIKKNIIVEDTCTQCGVCASVCPVNNIEMDYTNGKIMLHNKCFMCFACIQNCPFNAIHIKNEISRNRYRNHNITLKEIIDSNK